MRSTFPCRPGHSLRCRAGHGLDQIGPVQDGRLCAKYVLPVEQVPPTRITSGHHLGLERQSSQCHGLPLQRVRPNNPDRWMRFRHRDHSLQTFRKNPVVSEHDLAILARGRDLANRGVAVLKRGQKFSILHDPNPGIPRCVLPGDLDRCIGAAVVNDRVVPIAIRLGKHAFDALEQVPALRCKRV